VLKVPLQHAFGWDDVKYGHLIFVFQMAYALGMLCIGRLIDRLGTRIGYAVSMVFWSLASMAHSAANSFFCLCDCARSIGIRRGRSISGKH